MTKQQRKMPPHIREAFKELAYRIENNVVKDADLITRSRHVEPVNRKVSRREIVEKFGMDNIILLRIGSRIVSEIAWDFADSCINIAANLGLKETKILCRKIRELRRDYDRDQQWHFDETEMQSAYNDAVGFQEHYSALFSKISLAIRLEVRKRRPELSDDMIMLIVSAYTCAVSIRALARYCDVLETQMCRKLDCHRLNTVMPEQLFTLSRMILEFAGDAKLHGQLLPPFLVPYSEELVNRLLESTYQVNR